MTPADVGTLACPACRGPLEFAGRLAGSELDTGALRCGRCRRGWPVRDGLPRLVDEDRVQRADRFMRVLYDWFAPLHDPVTRALFPPLQGMSERAARDGYMERLALGSLRPSADGRALRILEVGVGAGANLSLLERDLPRDLDVELWGLDLSDGMLARCRRRLARHPGRPMHLLAADAHALPFADASFDRVFHVGGIGGYGDPRRGWRRWRASRGPIRPSWSSTSSSTRAVVARRSIAWSSVRSHSTRPRRAAPSPCCLPGPPG